MGSTAISLLCIVEILSSEPSVTSELFFPYTLSIGGISVPVGGLLRTHVTILSSPHVHTAKPDVSPVSGLTGVVHHLGCSWERARL